MQDNQSKDAYKLISTAFEGHKAPAQLSVAIVSLVELCQFAMPDPKKLHDAIMGANFVAASQERANVAGAYLALDNSVISTPVQNLQHKFYERDRNGEMVLYLLSEGRTQRGRIVFVSTLFRGAIEADAVKAVVHVSKEQPITGARAVNNNGKPIRRVFWHINNQAGIKGIVVTGPQDVESLTAPRGFTAFAEIR
ncbi:MAG: hypothetical protein JNL81_07510 [Hyphomonadaceae bacterium]|nr:hypothetical protein [Hyphomonadaceae bacterium]